MQFTTFKKRVTHNTEVLKKAIETNQPLTTILDKVYTWEYCPGEASTYTLQRNSFDIIPSLFLGSLASCTNNGVDGYRVDHLENIVPQEYKIGSYDRNMVWKGPQGGLNIGRSNAKSKFSCTRSYVSGSYTIHSDACLQSKNVETFLCVFEEGGAYTNTFIDIYTMAGEEALKRLSTGTKTKKREIKLNAFIKDGVRAATTVDLVGYLKVEAELQETAPTFYEWAGIEDPKAKPVEPKKTAEEILAEIRGRNKSPASALSNLRKDFVTIDALHKLKRTIAKIESGQEIPGDYNSSAKRTREWRGTSQNGKREIRAVFGNSYTVFHPTRRTVDDNPDAILTGLREIKCELEALV